MSVVGNSVANRHLLGLKPGWMQAWARRALEIPQRLGKRACSDREDHRLVSGFRQAICAHAVAKALPS
ncbi:hypothetical protein, partial [Mesorhizobium sp.]|uniref:hypothetical protein n=1 Tax=Mesorhizobium sp. TaxID=1871066 RepID=UPI0025C1B24F